jgi:hypothetical protein
MCRAAERLVLRSRLTLISTPTSEEVSQPLTATAISA